MKTCKYCGEPIKFERHKLYYRGTGKFAGYSDGAWYASHKWYTSDLCFTWKHLFRFHKPKETINETTL